MADPKLSVILTVLNQATSPLNQAASDFERFQGRVSKALAFTAVATSAYAATASLRNMFIGALEMGDGLQKASEQTGMTTRNLQELDFIATKSGTSLDSIKNGFINVGKLAGEAATGNKTAAASFKSIGVEIFNTNGTLKSQSVIINDTFMALAGLKDESLQSAKAQEIMGKSGRELIPVLKNGKDGIMSMREEANRLGVVLKDSTIKELDKAGDDLDILKMQLSVTKAELVSNFTPSIVASTTAVNNWVNMLSKGFDILAKVTVGGQSFAEVQAENQAEYFKSMDPSKSFQLLANDRDNYKEILDSKRKLLEENTKQIKILQDKKDAGGVLAQFNPKINWPITKMVRENEILREEIAKNQKLFDISQGGLNDLAKDNTAKNPEIIKPDPVKNTKTDRTADIILESEKMLQESKAGIIQDGYSKELRLLDDKYDQYQSRYTLEISDAKKRSIALANLTEWHKNEELSINVKYNDQICDETGKYLQEQTELEKREAEKQLAFEKKTKSEVLETERIVDSAKVDAIQNQSVRELAALQMRYDQQRQTYTYNEEALTNLTNAYSIERQTILNAQSMKQVDSYVNMTGRVSGIVSNWNTTLNNRTQNRIDDMKREGKETDSAIQKYRQQAKARQNILVGLSVAEAAASAVKSISQIWQDNTGESWWGNMALSIVSGIEVLATSAANISAIKSQSFASGTKSAPQSGWSLTGEQGPEYRWVNKGDAIHNTHETKNIMNQSAGNLTINLRDNSGGIIETFRKALRSGDLDGFVKDLKPLVFA